MLGLCKKILYSQTMHSWLLAGIMLCGHLLFTGIIVVSFLVLVTPSVKMLSPRIIMSD
jgi:hypothetical protein